MEDAAGIPALWHNERVGEVEVWIAAARRDDPVMGIDFSAGGVCWRWIAGRGCRRSCDALADGLRPRDPASGQAILFGFVAAFAIVGVR